jgi:hypothetical protein
MLGSMENIKQKFKSKSYIPLHINNYNENHFVINATDMAHMVICSQGKELLLAVIIR